MKTKRQKETIANAIVEAKEKMHGEIGHRMDIYPDGSMAQFYGNSRYLNDESITSLQGWSVYDDVEGNTNMNPEGEEKEGYVWDSFNNEWVDEKTAIDCEIDSFRNSPEFARAMEEAMMQIEEGED
jgi:hypothetical protein